MAVTQERREVTVKSHLGDDVLLFHRMSGREEMSRLFEYDLEFLSEDANINLNDLLGKTLTINLKLADGGDREFNGHITRFQYEGMSGDFHVYQATLHPWLWFLTQTSDCRIFQNKSVPDIIKDIFRDFGFADFEDHLTEQYPQRDYCVQFNETSFAFISRLMEEEGIYYYFRHEDERHILVMGDSIGEHSELTDNEVIPYYPPQEKERRVQEHIYDWHVSQQIQPSAFALNDYDFQKPRAPLGVRHTPENTTLAEQFEVFQYPGNYTDHDLGETIARKRSEQLQAEQERVTGKTNVRQFAVGRIFNLSNYPRDDQNREYLILSAGYQLYSNEYKSTHQQQSIPSYACEFTAMDSQYNYRPSRSTQKPLMQGPQTAVVVGPEGEKVWTDTYGRVKVQFHWDRYGQNDENSSCWVRVSQNWAGKHWGGMHIPHIGQEVIVEFLDGDPDRPIITGRVYNADNTTPMELPANKNKSTLQDDYGNQLIFDATPGDEHIKLYSPHHDSGLELGKSIGSWTNGDYKDFKVGNKVSLGAGTAMSAYAGFGLDAKGGAYGSVNIGPKFSLNATTSHDFNFGYSWSWSISKLVESRGDILTVAKDDLILAAGDQLCLLGGALSAEKRATEVIDKAHFFTRSLVNIFPESLTLSIGDDTKKLDKERKCVSDLEASGYTPVWKLEQYTMLTTSIIAGILAGIASSKAAGGDSIGERASETVYSGMAALLTLIAMGSAVGKKWTGHTEPVTHKNPDSMISVNKNGIFLGIKPKNIEGEELKVINADTIMDSRIAIIKGAKENEGEITIEKTVANSENSRITIQDDGDIYLVRGDNYIELTNDEIALHTEEGNISLYAPKGDVWAKGQFKLKNLTVKE